MFEADDDEVRVVAVTGLDDCVPPPLAGDVWLLVSWRLAFWSSTLWDKD